MDVPSLIALGLRMGRKYSPWEGRRKVLCSGHYQIRGAKNVMRRGEQANTTQNSY